MRLISSVLPVLLILPCACASAQTVPIQLFGNQPPRGQWRMELTESGDPRWQGGAVNICMDPTQNVGGPRPPNASVTCTSKTLQNTRSTAQFEHSCSDGRITRVTMTREADKVFSFAAVESGGKDAPTSIKGRYQYLGPCPADSAPASVKLDRNSPQCQEMRAQLGTTSIESACGQVPAGTQRDACVKQMEPLFKILRSCD